MEQTQIDILKEKATQIRKNIIEEVYSASSGHPGGSLSIADLLSYLYFYKMNVHSENPKSPDRDRFVLSKGHCCPALYAALALKGFFPVERLKTFRNINSEMQGHPDMKKINGIDMTTGSLGQGFSAACGMALAALKSGSKNKIYCITGDGELEEGQVWEAAMFAAHYKLGNLCLFVDFNGLQIDGNIEDVMNPKPIDKKFEAFGWYVQNIDGHSFEEIDEAVTNTELDIRPSVIICKTIKGKGVSFMENKAEWHGKSFNKEQYETALNDLNK